MRPWPPRCGVIVERVLPKFPTGSKTKNYLTPLWSLHVTHLCSRLFVRHVLRLEMRDLRPPDCVDSQILIVDTVRFRPISVQSVDSPRKEP